MPSYKQAYTYFKKFFMLYWLNVVLVNSSLLLCQVSIHRYDCHYEVIYVKVNLKVHYPPPYKCKLWHYKEAHTNLICQSIEMFDWDRASASSNVINMVGICTKTICNKFSNFIPHQKITIDDKDLPWFNTKIKSLL